MGRRSVGMWLMVLVLLLGGTALAGAKNMLLCLPGFPGTAAQAQPFVDKMLRHLEGKLGWEQGSLVGLYVPDGEQAASELKAKKPAIALVGPSIYVGQHKALKMKVIAKVEANGRGSEAYSVVTRKDGPGSLDELKGKVVEGAVVHDEKYVYNILLDRKLAAGDLTLKSEKRPLTALRDVVRGQAAGAIVDQSVIDHMAELPFAGDVRVVYASTPVPPPAVVVMGEGVPLAAKLKEVLVGICEKPDGKGLCETLTLSSVKDASDADYKALVQRYER